ncbi:MAG: helix-turn-helix transcriptional regulator, partial [Bacteroidaceae bacterium]|nr:helix-turn-helix transcriptional regulator [Bacteroidaceae bacterium]
MNNKNVFAENLNRYMKTNGKTRKDVSEAIGVSYYTLTDWVKGKKYPRMDKVEKLANYFGILKSDLIEEKSEEH